MYQLTEEINHNIGKIGSPAFLKSWAYGSSLWITMWSSVQLLSCVRLFATPRTTACQASLSITKTQSLPKSMSIESMMPSSHLILFHSIRVFSNELALRIGWSKYRSFIFSISPSDEYSRWISFRTDWFGTSQNNIWTHFHGTSESESCSVVSDSTVHGILQARILEWVAVPFSRGSSQPWDRT